MNRIWEKNGINLRPRGDLCGKRDVFQDIHTFEDISSLDPRQDRDVFLIYLWNSPFSFPLTSTVISLTSVWGVVNIKCYTTYYYYYYYWLVSLFLYEKEMYWNYNEVGSKGVFLMCHQGLLSTSTRSNFRYVSGSHPQSNRFCWARSIDR